MASTDNLDLVVHTLFDDEAVLPEPDGRLGSILLDGDEIPLLRTLGRHFEVLIDRLGNQPDEVYLQDESWDLIVGLASKALAAMVRRGGLEGLFEDDST